MLLLVFKDLLTLCGLAPLLIIFAFLITLLGSTAIDCVFFGMPLAIDAIVFSHPRSMGRRICPVGILALLPIGVIVIETSRPIAILAEWGVAVSGALATVELVERLSDSANRAAFIELEKGKLMGYAWHVSSP